MAMAFDNLAGWKGRLNRWATDPARTDDDVLTLTRAEVIELVAQLRPAEFLITDDEEA